MKYVKYATRELKCKLARGAKRAMTSRETRSQRSKAEVGRRLVALRSALGLKAKTMCAEVNVEPNTWSQWEKGNRMADLVAMMRVADIFGADLNYIYMGTTNTMPFDLATRVRAQLEKVVPPDAADPAQPC